MDGRRKNSRKRKVDDLERESNLLTDIMANFRHGSREEINDMVALIRAESSVDEAKVALERRALSGRQQEPLTPRQLEKEPCHPEPQPDSTQRDDPADPLRIASLLHSATPNLRHDSHPVPPPDSVSYYERLN